MVKESYNSKFNRVKDEIIKFLIQKKDRVAHESALFLHLGITSTKDKKTVRKVLNRLVLDGSILFDKKKRMITLKTNEFEIGEITLNGIRDYAIRFKNRKVSIKCKHLNGAYVGDTVLYSNKSKEIRSIVEKKNNPRIFEFSVLGNEMFLVPFNGEREDEHYRLVNADDLVFTGNEIISANIAYNEEDGCYDCYLKEVIGNRTDSDILGKIILAANGYEINFSKEALEEAELIPDRVYEEDMEGRIDLRHLTAFTLDCAKRMNTYDDALSVQMNKEGHIILCLHIIDVPHYVKPGSHIWNEARKRSKKIYMHGYRYARDMLPEKLSHGICSFVKGEDRLAKTISLEFDRNGELCAYDLFDSVINVKRNLCTKDADDIYNAGFIESNPNYDPFWMREFIKLKQLNGFIKQEPFIGVNSSSSDSMHGILINIIEYANERVANHFPTLPFIYKTFSYPTKKEIEKKVKEIEKKNWNPVNNFNYIKKKIIEKVLTYYKLPHTPIYAFAVSEILSNDRYYFSPKNKGHFKYGVERYTHVNSPARSFVNLVNLTLSDTYSNEFDPSEENMDRVENELETICDEYNQNFEAIERLDKLSPGKDCNFEQGLYNNPQGKVVDVRHGKILVSVEGQGMFRVFSNEDIPIGTDLVLKINRSPNEYDKYNAKILYYKNPNQND